MAVQYSQGIFPRFERPSVSFRADDSRPQGDGNRRPVEEVLPTFATERRKLQGVLGNSTLQLQSS